MTTRKPLPLKQRTSSVDQRRDYSTQTWTSLLGLLKLREYVVTVDHFSIWRRHLAWAVENGKDLRDYMTQRYASSMVFMSLLLSAELGVLFNSAGVTTEMRQALMREDYRTVSFWAGLLIIMSAILTILSLISAFTAWTMVSAISSENAHCILRSSIGQYVAELPGRFIVGSLYSFLLWLMTFFFILLPIGFWSFLLITFSLGLFVHTITAFSAFGRVIMHTGAMGSNRIFEPTYEVTLHPHGLHNNLLVKARANLSNKTSIMRQYKSNAKPINRMFSEDELSCILSDRSTPESGHSRKRTSSLVKFSDGYDTNGDLVTPRNHSIVANVRGYSGTPPSDVTHDDKSQPRPPRPLVGRHDQSSAEHTKNSSNVIEKWLTPSATTNHSNGAENSDPLGESIARPHLVQTRNPSGISSLDEFERRNGREASWEQRFHEDYGDLFGSDDENCYSYSEDEEQPNSGREHVGLLMNDRLRGSNYASFQSKRTSETDLTEMNG